ncbi:putative membrane protein [Massilia sp. LC238]|nr:putative membrane protein [Massilia sp. LC238]
MKDMSLSSLWLRVVLALRRMNPVVAGAVALALALMVAFFLVLRAQVDLDQQYAEARRQAALPPPAPGAIAPPAPSADQNLAHFYASLGERGKVERQLKTLFALAEKNGLALRQGEYRSSQDRAGRFLAYQITLPVTGRYGAIWQFAFDALRALPHASLDDVAFRRDAIGSETVEARLRLTLYLSATPGVPR